jgi:hypothetical protein
MNRRDIEWGDMSCIHLTQDRDQSWTVVNTIINFRVR